MEFGSVIRKYKFLLFTLVLCTLCVGILIGTLIDGGVRAEPRAIAPDAIALEVPDPVQLSNAFSRMALKLEPAVVNITVAYEGGSRGRRAQRAPEGEGGDDEDFFRRFFGNPFGDRTPGFRGTSVGSGVIVDDQGYLLTNWHVVKDANAIRVKLHGDIKEYEARLIGSDFETDLAVLKIEAGRPLDAAPIGNSDSVQVGDWVVAIGSPFGLDATVTAGIVSAKHRELADAQAFQRFLQTDAAINPGNSGGPLLNIRGEVIGINTAIASNSGSYQGIGFALPSNTAVTVYNQIIRDGRVTRGSIGISLSRVDNPDALRAYGAEHGVLVSGVTPNGPADRAGIEVEDVIVTINESDIKDGNDLIEKVAALRVGDEARVVILRGGEEMTKLVMIGDRSKVFAGDPRFSGAQPFRRDDDGEPEESEILPTAKRFGLSIQNIAPERLETMKFPEEGGVLITRVEPDSFAEEIGLRANDVIVSIGGQSVTSVEEVRSVREGLKEGDAVAFRVYRGYGRNEASMNWQPFFAAGTYREAR
jgi:serine protease Do